MGDKNEYLGWVDEHMNQITDLKVKLENKIKSSEISEAKSKLYSLLINLDENEISDNEVDLMFLLSKDEQIQNKLSEK